MYAVKVKCRKSRKDFKGIPIPANTWVYIVLGKWCWESHTEGVDIYGNPKDHLPNNLLLFETVAEATEAGRGWKGHPFWIKPTGTVEVVKVAEVTKEVFSHYAPVLDETL